MHRPSMRLQRFFFHPFSRSAGPWKLRSNETAAVSTTSSPAPPVQPAFHHKLVTWSRLSNLASRIDIEMKRFLKNVEEALTRRKHKIKLCEGLWTSRSVPYVIQPLKVGIEGVYPFSYAILWKARRKAAPKKYFRSLRVNTRFAAFFKIYQIV